MKRILLGVMVLALAIFASVAKAEDTDDADAHVWLDVIANMSIDVEEVLQFQDVQVGIFDGTVIFKIDANTQRVNLQVQATDLYKGDDPASAFKIHVGPDEGMGGALVEPTNANATLSHGNLLEWIGDAAVPLMGMHTIESEAWNFESGDVVFSQDVSVTLDYNQPDDELPMGEYSGWIKLIGICVPG